MNPFGLRSRQWAKLCAYAEEVRAAAHRASDDASPFWRALEQCDGYIIPDVFFDGRRWVKAGEFANIPAGLMRANTLRPATGKAHGNIDRITQIIRDELGDHGLTTSDVLTFYAENKRTGAAGQLGTEDRAQYGYTLAETKRTRALLRKEGVTVSVDEAEGYLQAALVAVDGGARYTLAMTNAERQAKHKAEKPEGECLTCTGMTETGRKYCAECNRKAYERVKRARIRKKEAAA